MLSLRLSGKNQWRHSFTTISDHPKYDVDWMFCFSLIYEPVLRLTPKQSEIFILVVPV